MLDSAGYGPFTITKSVAINAPPCRTFTQTVSQTNPAEEVYVLDTGYGAFTTTKSVLIVLAVEFRD